MKKYLLIIAVAAMTSFCHAAQMSRIPERIVPRDQTNKDIKEILNPVMEIDERSESTFISIRNISTIDIDFSFDIDILIYDKDGAIIKTWPMSVTSPINSTESIEGALGYSSDYLMTRFFAIDVTDEFFDEIKKRQYDIQESHAPARQAPPWKRAVPQKEQETTFIRKEDMPSPPAPQKLIAANQNTEWLIEDLEIHYHLDMTEITGNITNKSGQNYDKLYIILTVLDTNGRTVGSPSIEIGKIADAQTSSFIGRTSSKLRGGVTYTISLAPRYHRVGSPLDSVIEFTGIEFGYMTDGSHQQPAIRCTIKNNSNTLIPELRFYIRYRAPGLSSGINAIIENLEAGEERGFSKVVPFEATEKGKITIELDENFHK